MYQAFYRAGMLEDDTRPNDAVGKLTLADAMLGEVVTDLLRILAQANWPGTPATVRYGQTTRNVTTELEEYLNAENAVFPRWAWAWVNQVLAAVDLRDQIVHAIALDQCMTCSAATTFSHPRSGSAVDRSPEAVAALTVEFERLRARGLELALEVSNAVNGRIVRIAKLRADETGEIQNPPQVYPHLVEHQCSKCATDGQASTTLKLGAAVAVLPTHVWPHQKKYFPQLPDESDDR